MRYSKILVYILLFSISCVIFAQTNTGSSNSSSSGSSLSSGSPQGSSGKEIMPANVYFANISKVYNGISDYKGTVTITNGTNISTGKILYKSPNKLRIDFTRPSQQVVVSNGESLKIFMGQYRFGFEQTLPTDSAANINELASGQGFNILKRNYGVSYINGPNAITLPDIYENVIGLRFKSYSDKEAYKQIDMYFNGNSLIRRIVGINNSNETITLDLTDVTLNNGVSNSQFEYDFPPAISVENDFLFPKE